MGKLKNLDVYDIKTGKMIPWDEAIKDCIAIMSENSFLLMSKEPIKGIRI